MALLNYLTRIQFEAGAAKLLGEELKALGATSPLIVADRGVVDVGLVDRVIASGGLNKQTPVFDRTPENPTEAAALEGVAMFRERGCDSIVAIGGGSPIDLAKAVALLARHEPPLAQYAMILGGLNRITADRPPVIAVPTTAGTGSEVGRAALITLEDGRKLGFISPHMIPNVAICDPELTVGLPPVLTAATGMDAVTHCIETFLSPRFNPPAEAIALDGLGRAIRNLQRAVSDGRDLTARSEMMIAALEGGLTFQKGLGAVHALSHPLGGLKQLRLHHGTLNAVLLPAVLRFNADSSRDKYAVLRTVMGLNAGSDLAEAIASFSQNLGLPKSLGAMGVPSDCFPAIAKSAVEDHSSATNPRAATAEDYEAMLRQSLH